MNRLIQMVFLTNAASGSKLRLSFAYDYRGRRISKQAETWTGSTWSVTLSNKFLYDGWNLIAELNGTNNAVIRNYLWGTDLSGSPQGAGGVGGLLAVQSVELGVQSFVAFDGNGNVAALVKASDGSVAANYEYGPFGELTKASGLMARANPVRFSTKYQDDETDLVYYGYRYYNASAGRWESSDPLEEEGGSNLYGFVLNEPSGRLDMLGLKAITAAVVGSVQLAYDFCKGTFSVDGWEWAGVGFEWNNRWIGASSYYEGHLYGPKYVGKLLNCGRCRSCCSSQSEAAFGFAIAAFRENINFKGGLMTCGFLFTPETKCSGNLEGICLVNLIDKLGPAGALAVKAAKLLHAEAQLGVQANLNIHLCMGDKGVTSDSATFAGGGYIEFGWDPSHAPGQRPR